MWQANHQGAERYIENNVYRLPHVPLTSLAESQRSDSHSLAHRIFFWLHWEPVSRLPVNVSTNQYPRVYITCCLFTFTIVIIHISFNILILNWNITLNSFFSIYLFYFIFILLLFTTVFLGVVKIGGPWIPGSIYFHGPCWYTWSTEAGSMDQGPCTFYIQWSLSLLVAWKKVSKGAKHNIQHCNKMFYVLGKKNNTRHK